MISPTEAVIAPAPSSGASQSDIRPEADEVAEAATSQRINERRTLEENIEILRRARAL